MTNNNRPRALTWIAILLVVLSVLSIASVTTTSFGLARPQGNFSPSRNFPQAGGNFQSDDGMPPQGNGNFARGGGMGIFSMGGLARTLGLGQQVFAVIKYVSIGLAVLGVVLCLLAAYFIWKKQKRWALNLAVFLAVFFLLGALPGLFGGMGFFNVTVILRVGATWGKALAALPIVVLGLMPSVRDFTS